MTRRKVHEVDLIGDAIWQELMGDAEANAQALFGDVQPDAERITVARYREMVRRGYERQDRRWLKDLSTGNPKAFMEAVKALGVVAPDEGLAGLPATQRNPEPPLVEGGY